MAEVGQHDDRVNATDLPGVFAILGELGHGTLVTEEGLARILGKHPVSIRRAVERGELPEPTRLMGKRIWTVGTILRHIEKRLEVAGQEREIMAQHQP
jgi:hypothetical protein